MGCALCGRGFHIECKKCRRDKCHPVATQSAKEILTGNGRGRPLKNIEDMKDPHSTGRKRAAHLYPLFKDSSCEWSLKENCGGGSYPIIGCTNGKQEARHHGPVKDTRRNEPGNVHRICALCHNRWHTLNDEEYSEEVYSKTSHQPREVQDDITLAYDILWKTKKLIKATGD
jgi:hypothetical protein